jgi:multicomponent Na+:H+ antiporter subunit G
MIGTIVTFIIYLFLAIGVFFNILASIGLLRFPDVYTRLHAGTKCTTFGAIFLILSVVLLGLKMWYLGDVNGSVLSIHSFIALIAILLTNPTGAHAIARAAHASGVKPANAVVDHLQDKNSKTKKQPKNVSSKEKQKESA